MKLIINSILFLFMALNLNAQETETVDVKEEAVVTAPAAANEFRSDAGKYVIQFPPNWEIKEGFMGMDVIALSAVDGSEDQFRENVNVIYADLDQSISKEDYYDQNITLLEKLLTDYNLEDEGIIDVDGVEAKWIKYTHRMGQIEAKVVQYLLLNGNRAYVITFTANPADYPKYEGTFNAILNSFQFNQ